MFCVCVCLLLLSNMTSDMHKVKKWIGKTKRGRKNKTHNGLTNGLGVVVECFRIIFFNVKCIALLFVALSFPGKINTHTVD